MKRWRTEDFQGSRTIPYYKWWIHVIVDLSKLTECTTLKLNFNVNYGLWAIMLCQCMFINYNLCPTLVGDVDCGGSWARGVQAESIWELHTFCSILL